MTTSQVSEALATDVEVTEEHLRVQLADGRDLSVPLGWFPRLQHGTQEERDAWELIADGEGIHWEALDEDIKVSHLLEGRRSGEGLASFKRWLAARPAKGKK